VLHAKAAVADDEAVFVTSANLTEAALDRNIEVGLLVRDRALAPSVSSHFRGLIDDSVRTATRLGRGAVLAELSRLPKAERGVQHG
jgi:phosphatidylserine/phosphatidylglycerophosphate/cardiolipin synthase-like enzyme